MRTERIYCLTELYTNVITTRTSNGVLNITDFNYNPYITIHPASN